METILCKCGCGQERPRFDSRGREVFYIPGHVNREKKKPARIPLPRIPWNKGKSYVMKSKTEYANKGAWNMAMRRVYPDICMRCGWHESSCDTHHIVPRSKGGKYTIENGIILCPNCHRLADFNFIEESELRRIKSVV